jgi:hypothetical protein
MPKLESLTPELTTVRVDQSVWGRSEKIICGIVPSQIFEKATNRSDQAQGVEGKPSADQSIPMVVQLFVIQCFVSDCKHIDENHYFILEKMRGNCPSRFQFSHDRVLRNDRSSSSGRVGTSGQHSGALTIQCGE